MVCALKGLSRRKEVKARLVPTRGRQRAGEPAHREHSLLAQAVSFSSLTHMGRAV